MWHRAPRARIAPLVQVVLASSMTKLPSLKLRVPIVSADLLRNGLRITTLRAGLSVPTLRGPNNIPLGVNFAGPGVGIGVGVGVGVGVAVGDGTGVGVGAGVA